MREGQRIGDLQGDVDTFMDGKRFPGLDPGTEIHAGKIFHHNKVGAPLFFNGKDGDDVFVVEASHRTGFTEEPIGEGGIAGKMFASLEEQ